MEENALLFILLSFSLCFFKTSFCDAFPRSLMYHSTKSFLPLTLSNADCVWVCRRGVCVCKYVSVREYKQNCPFASFLLDLRNFQNNKQTKKNHHFFNFTIFSIGPQSPVLSWSYFVSLQFSTLWLCVGHIYLTCRSVQQHQENLCLKKKSPWN